VKVAAIQHDIVWEDRATTLEHLEPLIKTAAAGGARLAVLTEMFAVGFSMATDPEQAPGTDRPANMFVLAGPDGSLTRYAKIHPFSYTGEHEHFRAGDKTVTLDVEGMRTTPFVCYDLRFADTFWGVAAATDLYVIPANWPAARRHHWRSLLVARAIENQAYVVGVNRVGTGGKLDYAGDSAIIDPLGETLATAANAETVLIVDVDPEVVSATRARYPFMADRR
jgi:predicted amidohydrolase